MRVGQNGGMIEQPPSAAARPPGRVRTFLAGLLARRHGGVMLFAAMFLSVALVLRIGFLLRSAPIINWDAGLLAAFGWGVVFDLGGALLAALPLIVLFTVLPAGWGRKGWQRGLMQAGALAVLFAILFGALAEVLFWDEFGVRFNFIAVDYLVYTTEVIGNIRESYNLPLILGCVAALSAALLYGLNATGLMGRWLDAMPEPAGRRWRAGTVWFVVGLSPAFLLDQEQLPRFADNYQRELAKNGMWSFFAAFRNNELDYDQFYKTMPPDETFARLREELVEDGSILLRPDEPDTLRYMKNEGAEQHPNIIQITVESLSAEFLGSFNPQSTLTPELDALAAKSLVFDNFYATGNRTDRGMEALSLSLPPTPGRSLIKRPRNADLFTLGSVLRTRGYDTAFIYGGYGYFDNMNAFFGGNGYRVVDRAAMPKEDITFANAWGACDEDLFRWTMREADGAAAAGKPFHFFVMTTSNHRPYTYPEGRIDLPPKISGRDGAVKYTDYAIGQFIRDASTKPWFKNTVFVIVADHCASSAGKTEVPVQNYHIPLIIYAPGGQIAPGRIAQLTSQMDYAPTLLGLLNWSYPTRFFGHDVRRTPEDEDHALLGNYQKLGHIENGKFVVLSPRGGESTYKLNADGATLTPIPHSQYGEDETISFYAGASYLYRNDAYKALTPEEVRHYTELGEQLAAKSAIKPVTIAAHVSPHS